MATAKIQIEDGPCCPICLKQFNIPRQLPCAHSFCEKCLQSHITTEATKHKELRYVQCPVCRKSASPTINDGPTDEWASMFPANTVLQSVLSTKSKENPLCDACKSDGVSVPAESFCVECKEVMCGDCLKVHRKQKISNYHSIRRVEELECNLENVMKLAEGFTCPVHDREEMKYYCKDHNVSCCDTCYLHDHKMCSKVINLNEQLPVLLREGKPDEIIADMKKIETHLMTFMEMNEAFVNNHGTQVIILTDQISEVRKKINAALDELEKCLKTEGDRIYKEEVIRKQAENDQCLSLIHAVRTSHYLLEVVDKFGSNLQKFLMTENMKLQLLSYCNLVGETYGKTDTVTLEVEFAPPMQSMLSPSLSAVGKIVTKISSNTLPPTCLRRPKKDCQVERIDVIDHAVPFSKGQHHYSGVTFLSGDRVMLADYFSNQCILLSSSYEFIAGRILKDKPWNICALDDQEVAVSLYNQNKIQILSVVGDVILPVRMITTKYGCYGIAAAGKGEMVVNGYCGDYKNCWSLISSGGDVQYSHKYDTSFRHNNYVALNNMKTRVYLTVYNMNLLVCFDMCGSTQFAYSPVTLSRPRGVAVDRYDNIYVLGSMFHNIHQLSPDGSVLRVITSGVPKYPSAICIHKSKDMLIITNSSDKREIHIYQLK